MSDVGVWDDFDLIDRVWGQERSGLTAVEVSRLESRRQRLVDDITGEYHDQLMRIADAATRQLSAMWDSLEAFDEAGSLVWHAKAKPILEAAAQASKDLTEAWGRTLEPDAKPVSSLVVEEAGAHAFDPFDRLAARLRAGDAFAIAVSSARSVVEATANDAVHATARNTTSAMFVGLGGFVRRLNPGACKWCMTFGDIEFESAEQANFGHDNCKCAPVPSGSGAVSDWNKTLSDKAGFDRQERKAFDNRKQIRRLEQSYELAMNNSRAAATDSKTDPDPARQERLSIRSQEWETRAELLAERITRLKGSGPTRHTQPTG